MKSKNKNGNKMNKAMLVFAVLLVAVGAVTAYGMMGWGRPNANILQNADDYGMMGMHKAMMNGRGSGMMQMHSQVEKALESGDYQAFLKIHEDYGMNMDITEEQFKQMAEWHEAMEEGDYAKLQEMRDAGFTPGFGMMGKGTGSNGFGGCPMMQG